MAVISFKNSQAGAEELTLWHHDDIVARRDLVETENLSYQSFSAIPHDGTAQLSGGRDAEASHIEPVGQYEQRGVAPPDASTPFIGELEFRSSANPLDRAEWSQSYSLLTVRRLRPFARRRLSTRRPFFVLMRTRNPCVLLRCRLFGWNVRLPFMFAPEPLPPVPIVKPYRPTPVAPGDPHYDESNPQC